MASTEVLIPPEQMPVAPGEKESGKNLQPTSREGEGMTRRSFLKIAGMGAIGAAAAALGLTRLIKRDSPGSELFSSFPRTQPDQNTNNLPATSWPSPTPEETPSAAPSLTREAESSAASAVASETRAPTSTAAHTPEPTPTKTATNTVTPKPTETKTPTPVPELPPRIVEMPWGPVNLNPSLAESDAGFSIARSFREKWVFEKHGSWNVAMVAPADLSDWIMGVDRDYDTNGTVIGPLTDVKIVARKSNKWTHIGDNDYLGIDFKIVGEEGERIVNGVIQRGIALAVFAPGNKPVPSFTPTEQTLDDPSEIKVGQTFGVFGVNPDNFSKPNISIGKDGIRQKIVKLVVYTGQTVDAKPGN